MNTAARPCRSTTLLALLALGLAPAFARADDAAPNDGMRFVSVGGQADSRHDRQLLSTVSLPVGRHAWVQAGGGLSRDGQSAGGREPGIVTGAVGVAGRHAQWTLSAAHRGDGRKYRQTDVGSSLEWKDDGNVVGVDVTHRSSQATGTVAAGSGPVPAQARASGTGFGLHGTLAATERVSVYGAIARNHFRTTTTSTQAGPAPSGGLLGGLDPVLGRSLLGGASVVNRDEAALDHSALAGVTYRFDKVAVSGEYTTGQVHDNGGAMRSLELRAAIDVAPGWRVTPGIGRGTTTQAGHANFASVAATYGW